MRALALALLIGWILPALGADVDAPLILVANPALGGPVYSQSVLVVAPLGGDQHVGFIVNRPSDTKLGSLFPQHAPSQKVVDPVYVGGPLRPELIFALVQRRESPGGNSLKLMPGLYAAYEAPIIDRIIETDPQHARFVSGVTAWPSGELREELARGLWIVFAADAAIVMGRPDGLWEEFLRRWQSRANWI